MGKGGREDCRKKGEGSPREGKETKPYSFPNSNSIIYNILV